jgi:hypothetical protein
MSKMRELLKQGKTNELWQLCCGFLDLSLDEFMNIQKQLLLEQIGLLRKSVMGRKIMGNGMPLTIDEFRAQVPMTTYKDYCPELIEKREDLLPVKPALWTKTSGRSGEYPFKLIPVTHRFWEEASLNFTAIAMLGSCREKGDIAFKKGFKLLHAAAPQPFLTGNVAHKLNEDMGFNFIPPINESENISFEERFNKGFKMAVSGGMDGFFGLAGILVAIGEKFKQGTGSRKSAELFKDPGKFFRLLRGLIKSKLAGRPIMPKDLWSLKVIISMGTDSKIYKDKIKELWGRTPLDVYGNSESTVMATQTWDYNDMVFFPNLNFLEFIPEKEHIRWQLDHSYQPKTVLLNEVKAGENYEIVITNFHGGILVRYRIGDIVRITSLRNEKLGINLPQMTFERRADDLIDLGFMRLTERVIWQSIENTGIPYIGWTAHKEIDENSRLHLYLELDENYITSTDKVASAIYEQIKKIDDGLYVYKDLPSLEKLIDFKPIEVTLLPKGVFSNYKNLMKLQGADFSHQKPPHINPSERIISMLISNNGNSMEKKVAIKN